MSAPLPHGMNEADYETIEAAVTETVRGRWFLGEFARRNRSAEMRQILDAMARLETVVAAGQPSLPPADPSIRLMMQRIKEIAGQLEILSADLRDAGVPPRLADGVEAQARAVSGLMRAPGRVPLPPRQPAAQLGASPAATPVAPSRDVQPDPLPAPRLPRADLPASMARPLAQPVDADDPRLAALAALDGLALAQKLALFS